MDSRKKLVLAIVLSGVGVVEGRPQNPRLVRDINYASVLSSSTPQPMSAQRGPGSWEFVRAGAYWFLTAFEPATGRELYRTQGLPSTTTLVRDIAPGRADTPHIQWITAAGTRIFFVADDGVHGSELWTSDGTEANTVLVKDIRPGPAASNPLELTAVGDVLFFTASDDASGRELWRSDGSAAGTVLVKDVRPGPSDSAIDDLCAGPDGRRLFFQASDGTTGIEPWVSDGTSAGTVLLKDVWPGATGSSAGAFTPVGQMLFFRAKDPTHGQELWKSDGSTAGTVLVEDLAPGVADGCWLSDGRALGDKLIYEAASAETGREVAVSDGTEAGTFILKDLNPGIADSEFDGPEVFQNRVFFSAYSGSTGNSELHATDGTADGTVLIKEIRAGAAGSDPEFLTVVGSKLFLQARDDYQGSELWQTDGTPAGTVLVKGIAPGLDDSSPSFLTAIDGGKALFSANDGTVGMELFISDGTAAGTVLLADIYGAIGLTADALPNDFVEFDGRLFFHAFEPDTGSELWTSDGTAAGTYLFKDLAPGSASSNCSDLCHVGDKLVFSASPPVPGPGLFLCDGTVFGTGVLRTMPSQPRHLARVGDWVYFSVQVGSLPGRFELWRTNGTATGTTLVKAGFGGSMTSSEPYGFTPVGREGKFLFRADDNAGQGNELWISDGSESGTRLLVDLVPGAASSYPTDLAPFADRVVFSANGPTSGREPWLSDGTPAGTRMITDLVPGPEGSNPTGFARFGQMVLFGATTPLTGTELWRSDGSSSGTVLVRDIHSTASSGPLHLTAVGSRHVLLSCDDGNGRELWESDGTATGTRLLADIHPIGGSNPHAHSENSRAAFTVIGNRAFFAADDGQHGFELWCYDNGATAWSAAPGCGTPTRVPSLFAEDPRLGLPQQIVIDDIYPGAIAALIVGLEAETPLDLGHGCRSHVGIVADFIVLEAWQQTSGKQHTHRFLVPNEVWLLDRRFALQSWVLATDAPTGFDLSDGVSQIVGR